MALEEKVKDAEFAGKPFGIDPTHSYDRKEFVSVMEARKDIKEAYEKLDKSKFMDTGALMDLAAYSSAYHPGEADPNARFQELWTAWSRNPVVAMDYAKNALLDPGEDRLAKYVENNRPKMLDELDEGKLHQLWTSIPLYQTGDKELDRAAETRNKVMQIQKAMQGEGNIDEVIQAEIDALIKKVPEEQRNYIFRNGDLVFGGIRKAIVRRIQTEFSGLFKDKDGKLDKKALIKAIEKNYDAVKDFMEDRIPEEDKKSRYDFWSDNIKPVDIALAETLHSPAKKEQKWEDDSEKEQWKQDAGKRRMAA